MKFLWIGLGGFLGAIARYMVGVWCANRFGTRFPYGTFVINITGCFAIGFIVTMLDARVALPIALRYAIPVGFIGAYTTFSTFEFEAFRAAQANHIGIAVLYVTSSLVVGYLAVWLGAVIGRVAS